MCYLFLLLKQDVFCLSCLFRGMTCFWVLWPCNLDGCIHINQWISETLMSPKWKTDSLCKLNGKNSISTHFYESLLVKAKTVKFWHFSSFRRGLTHLVTLNSWCPWGLKLNAWAKLICHFGKEILIKLYHCLQFLGFIRW